jgi:CubicO group peptidase (beta-lactamase class C family)
MRAMKGRTRFVRAPALSFAACLALLAGLRAAPATSSQAAPAAQSAVDGRFEQLSALIQEKMKQYGVPGVGFGVIKQGQVLARGFGVTNVENPQPITPDTVFPIASISKTIAATAVMRLVEQGLIELDAPVRQYLPDFRTADEATTNDVLIWHLLTHTPGWEGQLSGEDRGTQTLAHFVDTMRTLPALARPGEMWSYNNAGFSVLGRVIEVVTKRSIHDALRTLVFTPLGLTRTFTRLEDVSTHRFSVAHRSTSGSAAVMRPPLRSTSITAGGAWMSLNDALAYAAFHLGDGRGVLKRVSLADMRLPRVPKRGTDDEMGLGWHLRRVGGVLTSAHGGTLGHCLLLELVPDRDLAFVIFTNHSGGWQLIQDVERAALRLYEGLALKPGQAIGHRGVNETMPDAPILATQPDPAPYLGVYRRPPVGSHTVRIQDGTLMIDGSTIAFYAPDRAVVTSGNSRGNPIEFVRDGSGQITWVRVVGRIARRDR